MSDNLSFDTTKGQFVHGRHNHNMTVGDNYILETIRIKPGHHHAIHRTSFETYRIPPSVFGVELILAVYRTSYGHILHSYFFLEENVRFLP